MNYCMHKLLWMYKIEDKNVELIWCDCLIVEKKKRKRDSSDLPSCNISVKGTGERSAWMKGIFWTNTENFLLLTQIESSQFFFNFFVKNAYLTPLKKLFKFTKISRTVRTFAEKTEINQNTENFHPWIWF
jgi:hypothetical protein